MYYIDTFKRDLFYTDVYKLQASLIERVVVDGHGCHTALHFGEKAKENQDKVPSLYWLHKFHKQPLKQDLLLILVLVRQQNFLSYYPHVLQLLKNMLLSTVTKNTKNLFWSIKNSGEVLDKLKASDFNTTSLSTYEFSTLYTTLPNNLIKDKLIDLIERTFNIQSSPYLECNDRITFFASEKTIKYHAWFCQNVCEALTFLLDKIFIRFGTKL